jgi:hypothetical protein
MSTERRMYIRILNAPRKSRNPMFFITGKNDYKSIDNIMYINIVPEMQNYVTGHECPDGRVGFVFPCDRITNIDCDNCP